MKNRFKKILCPIDFDENSTAALEAARDLAVDPKATLYVLHVIRLVLGGFPKEFRAYPLTEQAARARLQDIAREHLEGKVRYEILTRTGDPASVILSAVEELAVDSVVMATHGRTGLGHFFLGSVAERVVRESPQPVLTIRQATK
jgi:universal stress protein A